MHPPGAWDVIADVLVRHGTTAVYGLPDDDMRAARALQGRGVEFLWTVSQRTAVNMAAGTALATGRLQVCVLGRGPAVAVAVPGLLEACYAGAPVLVLVAGTATSRLLQGAFQDAPVVEVARPLTKWAVRVPDGAGLAAVLESAVARATAVPRGPVLVEVPDDLQAGAHDPTSAPGGIGLEDVPALVAAAERPLVVLGGGARWAGSGALRDLVDHWRAAAVVTASGRGCFPEDDRAFLGLAGLYMTPPVADVVATADLVVVLGSRLEETAVLGAPGGARWLQVNSAVEDVVFSRPGHFVLATVEDLLRAAGGAPGRGDRREAWRAAVQEARAAADEYAARWSDSTGAHVVETLSSLLPRDCVVVHENGLHDMWSYVYPLMRLPAGTRSVAPSEQTTLGFGVAAAAGVAAGTGDLVVCICGDGAFDTFVGDAAFLSRHPMRLLYVVMDDGGLGWLDRQAQRSGVGLSFLAADGWPAEQRTPVAPVLVAGRRAEVAATLAEGVRRAQSGLPTVVRIRCDRADVPSVVAEDAGPTP